MKVFIEPEIQDYTPIIYSDLMKAFGVLKYEVQFRRVRAKLKKKRASYYKYKLLNQDELEGVDLVVVFSPYATSHNVKKWCNILDKPLLHLENGFLYKSVLCDIGGFWADAIVNKSIESYLDSCSDDKHIQWANNYIKQYIKNNISKRQQPTTHSEVKTPFVFLPMQYMNDQSVISFGNMAYPKFVDQVAQFCFNRGITLAIKKHPHAYKKEVKDVDNLFRKMKKRYGAFFKEVDGSIHWFCQNCLFMAGMNTGATADGLVNGCVISHCGESIFKSTGAVVHNNDVQQGLEQCLHILQNSKQREIMVLKQKALLYFLYNRYLLLEEDSYNSEFNNVEKIIRQVGVI